MQRAREAGGESASPGRAAEPGAKNHGPPPTNSYCQSASAGIYSVPSLAPLANKVSQVEMEAGDCDGRLPPLFLPDVSCQMSDVRMTAFQHLTSETICLL